MKLEIEIKRELTRQGLPCKEIDIPHINQLLNNISSAELKLRSVKYLNQEVPITVVDKELFL